MANEGSLGPEIQAPVHCPTIELKDLSDVTHFEDKGEVGGVYAFELTDAGFYKRKEIDTDEKPKFPKLEQIRDLDVGEFKNNINYTLQHKKQKWTLVPSIPIDWSVKFEFKSPYTLVSKNFTLRKALNAGSLIVSLIPDKGGRNKIAIKPYMKNRYIASGDMARGLDFIPEIKIGNEFTMIFDIILRGSEQPTHSIIMKGIKLKWSDLTDSDLLDLDVKEETRVFVAIRKKAGAETILADSDNKKLTVLVIKENLTHLNSINLSNLDLVSFYFTDTFITEDEMGVLLN